MSRRSTIANKLALAGLPMMVAVGALLALNVRSSLDDAANDRRSAAIVSMWLPIMTALDAVDTEGSPFETPLVADTTQAPGAGELAVESTTETDVAIAALWAEIGVLGDPPQLVAALGSVVQALGSARSEATSAPMAGTSAAYQRVELGLGRLGALLPSEARVDGLGRELEALSSLLNAKNGVDRVSEILRPALKGGPIEPVGFTILIDANTAAIDGFEAAASSEWMQQWNETGVPQVIETSQAEYLRLLAVPSDELSSALARTDLSEYRQSVRRIGVLFDGFTAAIMNDAQAREEAATRTTYIRVIASAVAVLIALLLTWGITRSITRRIKRVSDGAHAVAVEQLPALVSALRDPKGLTALPEARPIIDAGTDEVGDLAASFMAVQRTLGEVAAEQMAVMRRGVSDIFVTLARRNRTLIDRQLALLDTLEHDVDDPRTLADYFQLDHLATRMRRNAENLLVLAGSDSHTGRMSSMRIDDVVRAAISEVEDYRRIEVLSVQHLAIRGSAIADLAHLLAELLDNAAACSPPNTTVRVSGHGTAEGYVVTISDDGLGMTPDRLATMNELLANPPVVGLSVEPTLGLSVVSLLAAKHQIRVTLAPGAPGITVRVVLTPAVFDHSPTEVAPMSGPHEVETSVVAVPVALVPAAPELAALRIDLDAHEVEFAPAMSVSRPASPSASPPPAPPHLRRDPLSALAAMDPPPLPPLPLRGPMAHAAPGLPRRVPGAAAAPLPEPLDRTIGAGNPEQVRRSLAAFTSGRDAATATPLQDFHPRLPSDAPPDGEPADLASHASDTVSSGGDRL